MAIRLYCNTSLDSVRRSNDGRESGYATISPLDNARGNGPYTTKNANHVSGRGFLQKPISHPNDFETKSKKTRSKKNVVAVVSFQVSAGPPAAKKKKNGKKEDTNNRDFDNTKRNSR